jgi:protein phosphatase
VIKNKCYVINLGDTRAVICENGLSRRVSNDHKTKDEGEIKRIREAGGVIMRGRVSGTLAVTRALGDLTLKNEGVINVPDVFEFEINKNT